MLRDLLWVIREESPQSQRQKLVATASRESELTRIIRYSLSELWALAVSRQVSDG